MPKEQEPAQVLKRFRKEGWTLYTGKGSHVVVRKDGIQISVPTSKKRNTDRHVPKDCKGCRLALSPNQ